MPIYTSFKELEEHYRKEAIRRKAEAKKRKEAEMLEKKRKTPRHMDLLTEQDAIFLDWSKRFSGMKAKRK